jgi:phenylalanyl-tRNA synthetase beta chain
LSAGVDPTLVEIASRRAAQLILETGGGELLKGAAVAGREDFKPRPITLRLERLNRLLGVEISADEALDALKRLHLSPAREGNSISVTAPSWRSDLNMETDLIEEVTRVVGYERIPVRETIQIELTPPEPEARVMEIIRSTLVGAGFFEAVTFTFVSDALAGDFLHPRTAACRAQTRMSERPTRGFARALSRACSKPSAATRPTARAARSFSKPARPSVSTRPAKFMSGGGLPWLAMKTFAPCAARSRRC